MAARVLIVDDEEAVRRLESQILDRSGYSCTLAASLAEAENCLRQMEFDLALIDINMPGGSGLDLAKSIRTHHPDVAALMVTGVDDLKVANTALESGALGYVLKPFQANELLINVASALRRHQVETENRTEREKLEQTVQERTTSAQQALALLEASQGDARSYQEETILRLARAAESRDTETGQHLQRMSRYCELLAQLSGLDPARCVSIRLASILHDVGKIGIPDRILLKPGPLTPHETNIMRQHTDIGHRILIGSKGDLIQLAADIAWTHHEKYDGTGYPRGLRGDAIPLEGRIAAIADVFDGLTSQRVYRPAYRLEKALTMMRGERGKHFDPHLLDVFFNSIDRVLLIKDRFL
ncbi:MAG: response regulator [Planctomycetes bacterium]|nr:response regulator [Planctomycetota bacterium]